MNYNQSISTNSLVPDGVIHYKFLYVFLILLISSFSNRGSGQCSSTEVQVEIYFEILNSNLDGEAIKVIDITNDLEVYCKEFGTAVFVDTICISENASFNLYGYDNLGENWRSNFRITYLNDSNNCGPTSDSLLFITIDQFTVNGMGQIQCDVPIDNDRLIAIFNTPSVSCPVSISGQIKTFTDQPVENVTVVANTNNPNYPSTVFSDIDGEYEFGDNPSGLDYEIEP